MPPTTPPRAARIGVTAVFFVYGAVLSTWVSRIPVIKTDLGLDTAQLSLALVGSPVGLILAVQGVTALIGRFSSARVTQGAIFAACLSLLLPGVAQGLPALAAALFALGMSMGALDIAMNTQAVAVERRYGRPIVSGIHGWYSVGVLTGASAGALAIGEVATLGHFAVAAALLAAVGLVATRGLLGREADTADPYEPEAGAAPAARPDAAAPADAPAPEAHTATGHASAAAAVRLRLLAHPGLVALGAIAFCCLFAEGAIDDWSGVYLFESQGASLSVAPLGAAAAGLGMAVGRFLGDAVIARIRRPATLTRSALIAATGMTVALAAPVPGVAIAGYAILGLGVATIVPIAFTLAGNAPGVPPAWAISRVTTIGYAGLFSSPPLVGLVAHATSLTAGLAICAVLLLGVALLARRAA